MKRLLSLVLIVLMLFSCISCAGNKDEEETESSVETVDSNESKSGVPEGTDFGGKSIKIWYTTTSSAASESFVDLNPDMSGDSLQQSIWVLNNTVSTRLNVVLDYENTGVPSSDAGTSIQRLILSGDDTYDVFNIIEWNCATLAAEGFFLDVNDMPYLVLTRSGGITTI